MKNKGFTLVELMIVVAIIGVLSAIAVPNFKKYQAKSKTVEAKMQLAAAYTAEQAFFGEYNIYHNCLSYMGYDPSPEVSQRYYSVGFNAASFSMDASAYNSAKSLGLKDDTYANGGCPDTGPVGTTPNTVHFTAGRGIGGSIALVNPYLNSGSVGFLASIGDQSVVGNMTFLIAAAGVISAEGTLVSNSSVFTIDQNKKISTVRNGY